MEHQQPGSQSDSVQSGVRPTGDQTWLLPRGLRLPLLLLPPLLLAILEVLHPNPDATVEGLLDAATWFAVFHAIQLVLIGMVALSVILLADSYGYASAWTTRIGIGVFLVFFSAYDTIAGIGTGLAMRGARDLTPEQQEGVFNVVKDWPGLDWPFALSIIGTGGWLVAVGALALAARRRGAPRSEWIFTALAAFFLLGGHPFPAGTLAFGCLFAAALLREWPLGGAASGRTRSTPDPPSG